MRTSLAAEVEVLATQLDRIAQLDRHTADFTRASMREAIVETIARFPGLSNVRLTSAASATRTDASCNGPSTLHARTAARGEVSRSTTFCATCLLGDAARDGRTRMRAAMLEFAMKFQQVTAPVTAKGVEDTAFYRYNRLIMRERSRRRSAALRVLDAPPCIRRIWNERGTGRTRCLRRRRTTRSAAKMRAHASRC